MGVGDFKNIFGFRRGGGSYLTKLQIQEEAKPPTVLAPEPKQPTALVPEPKPAEQTKHIQAPEIIDYGIYYESDDEEEAPVKKKAKKRPRKPRKKYVKINKQGYVIL